MTGPSASRSSLEVRRSHAAARRVLFGDDVPVTVGRYEVTGRIGLGGMGIVYSARDARLGRDVAIKVVHPGRVELDASAERTRLLREARNLARVSSAHVVEVLDVGVHDEQVYFAMELAQGPTLDVWLSVRRRSTRDILGVFADVARGLADAHALDVVHGDVKPSNILVTTVGGRTSARLIDFGLGSSTSEDTTAGGGTPAFMAPEVREGGPVTVASDQYSFCVALQEALQGRAVPRGVRRLLRRGLRADPTGRWGSMRDVVEQLERRAEAGSRFAIAVTGGLGALAAAGLWLVVPASDGTACSVDPSAEVWGAAADRSLPRPIQRHLDAYVVSWRAADAQACEAADEVARACLQQRLDRLAGLLAVDGEGVNEEAWTLAVARIDPPDRCLSTAEGGDRDPEVLKRIESARALVATEPKSERARQEAMAAWVEASESDRGAEADALLVLGRLWRARGRLGDAATAFERAAFEAEGWHHDRVAAEALCERAALELEVRGDYDAARAWIRHARSAVGRTSGAPDLEARVDRLAGALALRLGDLDEAARCFERSMAELETWFGPDHVALAGAEHDLGSLYAERRELEAARLHLERARKRWEREYGELHPVVATAWSSLGAVAEYGADYDAALQAYDEALAALEHGDDPSDPRIPNVSLNVANAVYRLGRYDEASERFEHARRRFEALNPDHPNLGHVHLGLGNIARDQGRWQQAASQFDRAADVWRRALGDEHMLVAMALSSSAEARLNLGQQDEAEPLLRESIGIREVQRGPDDPSIAYPLTTLGRLLQRRGDLDDADRALSRALELRQASPKIDRRLRAETEFALARLRRAQGRHDEAKALGEAAREHFQGPWEYADADVAMVQRWLDGG
jgi:tetratricopeptide (TPR) repeat protein